MSNQHPKLDDKKIKGPCGRFCPGECGFDPDDPQDPCVIAFS